MSPTGVYGTNYVQRALLNFQGPGWNRPEDSVYPNTRVDGEGKPLSGANKYVIHFQAGQLPPVKGFWSLTMYDTEGFFVPTRWPASHSASETSSISIKMGHLICTSRTNPRAKARKPTGFRPRRVTLCSLCDSTGQTKETPRSWTSLGSRPWCSECNRLNKRAREVCLSEVVFVAVTAHLVDVFKDMTDWPNIEE